MTVFSSIAVRSELMYLICKHTKLAKSGCGLEHPYWDVISLLISEEWRVVLSPF